MSWLKALARVVWGILRELSDESAYARHLAAKGLSPSAEEWRRFSECQMKRKYARAKCC
jgi:hypothetical protein